MLYVSISLLIILRMAIKPPKFVDRMVDRAVDKLVRKDYFNYIKRRIKRQRRNFWKYQTFHTAKFFTTD